MTNYNEVVVYEYTGDDSQSIPVVTSREIANTFERQHKHILDSIRNLMGDITSEVSDEEYFIESSYEHPTTGLEVPEYFITKDGFTLLVMGFTGSKALNFKIEYIKRFNEMEAYIREQQQPTDIAGMIDSKMIYQIVQTLEEKERQVKEQQLQIETQEAHIEEQANYIEEQEEYIDEVEPKVLFANSVGTSEDTILVGELAKILAQNGIPNMGQNRLFKWMRNNGFLLSRGIAHNTPSQRSTEMGLFRIQERTIIDNQGNVQLQRTPKITGKGQLYFINKLTKLHESGQLARQMSLTNR